MIIRLVFAILIFSLISCSSNHNVKNKEELSYKLMDSLTTMFEQGNIEGSLKGVKEYLSKNSDADYAYNLLAIIYLAKQEDSLALVNVKKCLELNPNNYGALTNYGIVLDRKGEYKNAYDYYVQAVNIKPDFAQAYSNLMGNRIAIGDIEGARDYGEKAVVIGNYLTDKGLLCAIYHKLGLYEKRDTLYKELKELKYENLNSLEQIFFD